MGNGQTIFSPGRPEDVTEGGAKVEVQEEVQEEAGSEGEVEVETKSICDTNERLENV